MTKWCVQDSCSNDIPEAMATAFDIGTAGRYCMFKTKGLSYGVFR
ncbi:hypothetical protein [Parashewanella hymeniacidonis]|nr:hypothetical protein [Parashewanella hymeniacidonis]